MLLKNSTYTCYKEKQQIIIKEKQTISFLIGLGGLIIAVIFYFSSQFVFVIGKEYALNQFIMWTVYILAPASLFLVFLAFFRLFKKPITFHLSKKQVLIAGQVINFASITQFGIEEIIFSNQKFFNLILEANGKNYKILKMLTPAHKVELDNLTDQINVALNHDYTDNLHTSPPESIMMVEKDSSDPFYVTLFITIGIIWIIVGYLVMPNIVLTVSGEKGIFIWPFGIWIAIVGILQLLKVPMIDWLKNPTGWQRVAVFIWIASYVLICFTW